MNLRAIWRAFVLFGIFFVLLIAGWHELPGGESLLSWYVIIASVAVPAAIVEVNFQAGFRLRSRWLCDAFSRDPFERHKSRPSPAVINRQQKITFGEMRARLPRDDSKKPPDLRREVFV